MNKENNEVINIVVTDTVKKWLENVRQLEIQYFQSILDSSYVHENHSFMDDFKNQIDVLKIMSYEELLLLAIKNYSN